MSPHFVTVAPFFTDQSIHLRFQISVLRQEMEKDHQIRVIIVGGGVVGLVLANALEVENIDSLRHTLSEANRLPASRHRFSTFGATR
jgi:hypothetical protein